MDQSVRATHLGLSIGPFLLLSCLLIAHATCSAAIADEVNASEPTYLMKSTLIPQKVRLFRPGKFYFGKLNKFFFNPSKGFLPTKPILFIPPKHGLPVLPPPPTAPLPNGVSVWYADYVAPNCIFNRPVTDLPASTSPPSNFTSLAGRALHADFGTCYEGRVIGIPWNVVDASVPLHPMTFFYDDEADYGPPSPPYPAGSVGYPIPSSYIAEGSLCPGGTIGFGDNHCSFVVPATGCLFETGGLNGGFSGGAGAVFNLYSNAMRPLTWTSADAAGLPISPLLVKYIEVQAAVAAGRATVGHAFRFTLSSTRNQFIWPASHQAGSNNAALAPMGMRIALRPNFDVSSFSPINRVILNTMKTYGMFVADNGSNGYISGDYNPNWNDDDLHALGRVTLGDFYVVDESSVMLSPTSYQAVPFSGTFSATSTSEDSTSTTTSAFSHHTNSRPRAR